jgi:RNA polymerase sporulation-specific sigma factor
MISAALLLLTNSLILTLRMSGTAGTFPKPLSAEEEKKYLELYAAGDEEAREVLIERNLRLVAHIIKKYYTKTRDREDLISIGTIGLIKGISSYRSDKGVRLATYAARCIENEILMYFRSQKKTAGEVSLSESIETDKDGNSLSLMDVVSVDDTMLDDLSSREMREELRRAMKDTLTEREAEIIGKRYGIGYSVPKTQREIAEELGISRSYVSRIEKKALEKLEEAMGGEKS